MNTATWFRFVLGLGFVVWIHLLGNVAYATYPRASVHWVLPPPSNMHIAHGELHAALTNASANPQRGEIIVRYERSKKEVHRAPFLVPPNSTVNVRALPLVRSARTLIVELALPKQRTKTIAQLDPPELREASALLDLEATPGFRRLLEGAVDPNSRARGGWRSTSHVALNVVTAKYDKHGDAILPRNLAGYASIALVLSTTKRLLDLAAADRATLLTYISSGGSLALFVSRPDDLNDDLMKRLLGGAAIAKSGSPPAIAPLPFGVTKEHSPFLLRNQAKGSVPQPPEKSWAYQGANLKPSWSGQRASYGRGSVYLLAFNPYAGEPATASYRSRHLYQLMLEARQQSAQRILSVSRWLSNPPSIKGLSEPRQNNGTWLSIMLAILCLYALIAGPLTFHNIGRKRTARRAYIQLASLSGGTFASFVLFGSIQNGCSSTVRSIGLIETAPGMPRGHITLIHGVRSPRVKKQRVHAHSKDGRFGPPSRHGLVPPPPPLRHDGRPQSLIALRPADVTVVAEQTTLHLGATISVQAQGNKGHLRIHNATAYRLGPALVWLPKLGEVRLAKKLEPGQTQTTEGLSVLVKPVATIGNHRISLDSLPQHPDESVQRMFADLSSLLKTKRVYPELSLHRAPVVVGQLHVPYGLAKDNRLEQIQSRIYIHLLGTGGRP